MTDMNAVIVPKSDQINADDLIGGPRTIRIAGVKVSPGTEQPVSIAIEGDGKVYRPCKSMARVMVAAWGADSSVYSGRSLTLYRDPKVKWGGLEVGGIRIGAMSDLASPMTLALTETRASRKPFTVKPLAAMTAPTDAAAVWLAEYRANLARAATPDELADVQQRSAKALAKLSAQRPDLHGMAMEAGLARFREIAGPDDDGVSDGDDFPGDRPSDDRVGA